MKPLRLLLFCLLPLPLWSEAQTAAACDSLGILRRAEFHNAPLATLDASAYESSPAAMLYRYPVSYSTTSPGCRRPTSSMICRAPQ